MQKDVGVVVYAALVKKLKKIFVSGNLVNNITVNWLLSPLYFIFIVSYLEIKYPHVQIFSREANFFGKLPLALFSTWFYCYASTFFQPDLDGSWRPGDRGFPLGKWSLKYPIGNTLMTILRPVNRIWFYFWELYSRLITHRGISHWPIIGVWSRVFYILLHVWLAVYIMDYFQLMLVPLRSFLLVIESWCRSFFPWNAEFGSAGFYLLTLPVFVSDIAHSLVDYIEAKAKGKTFVPSLAKRGWLYKLFVDRKKFFKSVYEYIDKF